MEKDNRKYRFCFIDYMWYIAEKWSEREHNNLNGSALLFLCWLFAITIPLGIQLYDRAVQNYTRTLPGNETSRQKPPQNRPYLHRTGCGEYRTDVSPRIYTLGMTIPAATATAMTTA